MNSLEFIEKQILLVQQNIQYHKNLLAESGKEYANEIISAIKLLEPELQTLLQIKSELEAWNIIKDALELTENELGEEEIEMKKNFFMPLMFTTKILNPKEVYETSEY